ncbi:hypothetical protein MKZ24_03620 [Paenibacillus sp. FSL R7-0297]|uniref:hypothetical protein n=1 Tax=Paenibacillus sp. FSL R7-0297 TaxID=2921680 RepID=UPI0030FC4295
MKFEAYDEFLKEYNKYNYHNCECGGVRELSVEDLEVVIENRSMLFEEFILLTCLDCGTSCLPQYSKQMIGGCYKIMIDEGHLKGVQRYNGYKKQFNYCLEQNFTYDHRDYYNIPGLCFDEEHSEEGFLVPVYFSKKVLLYFMHDPDYKMMLFSETYGHLRFRDEWDVPFGINRNGIVVFWLGDLNYMDSTSLSYMKPHNIQSDHQLVQSEFYAAQMSCAWSQPNKELNVCYKKKELFEQFQKRYGVDLFHLDEEVTEHMNAFIKPVIITTRSIESAINMLHKVLIEGVNISSFKKLYLQLYPQPQKGFEDWKSIKLYQAVLENVVKKDDDIKDIIAPLYLLNDLRQYYDHLLPKEKRSNIEGNIIKSLGISSFKNIDEVYIGLIDKLNILFQYLIVGYSD